MEHRNSKAKGFAFGLSLLGLCLAAGAPAMAAAATNEPEVQAAGPDVTVFDLMDINNYGTSGGVRGYSIGTRSCNIGTQPLNWCDNGGGCGSGTTNRDHPVIAQNVYRLKDGRFQQIGASWLKHGFLSTNSNSSGCGTGGGCVQPPLGQNQLGVGCTDPYEASLNGSRPLGRRSEVNPATGAFPFPPGGGGSTAAVWNQRAAVAETDLNPTLNTGATYYVEGHYIAPDDAAAGNGLNNAAYRRVTIGNAPSFNMTFAAATVREKSAIEVWPTVDPTVEMINVDVPTAPIERYHVARKVTDLGGGNWHYEYAVHNMNSKRAASSLAVTFGQATVFTNVGFADVNAHSNEPYDTTDWSSSTTGTTLTWATPFFTPAENANALRWATMYNFWFDANRPPEEIAEHVLGLFEAGLPASMTFWETKQETPLFKDGFETGDASQWSVQTAVGPRPAR